MIRLFVVLVIFAATVYGAILIKDDPGYALVSYGSWTVEMTLVLLVSAVVVATLAIAFGIMALIRTFQVPTHLKRWRAQRKVQKALETSNQGYIQLAEGNWAEAEKLLNKNADKGTPMLNYLAAARAAQEQGSVERRDKYLMLAHKSNPDADVAVGLTQAELQLANGQEEQALATLMHLRQLQPRHTQVMKRLMELYLKLQSWHDLNDLIGDLRRRDVLSGYEADKLERRVQKELLTQSAQNLERLNNQWQDIPRSRRIEADMTTHYCQLLLKLNDHESAGKFCEEGIKREWYIPLVELYGEVKMADAAKQLSVAEGWLKQHSNSPELLLVLGKLCMRNELWGKARDYLNASLEQGPCLACYQLLGSLLENQLSDPQAASLCYREGMEFALSKKALVTTGEQPIDDKVTLLQAS